MSHKKFATNQERRRAEYQRAKARKLAKSPPPPDPITLLTVEDRAYIAGLLDGEGALMIGRVGPKRLTYYPIVFIGMTHLGVIEWLQSKLATGTIKLNNHTSVRNGWRPQHSIRLHGKRAKLLCQTILPYMKVKAQHATIIASFPCEARKGRSLKLSDEVQSLRVSLYEQIKPLNYRGPDAQVTPAMEGQCVAGCRR